MFFGKDINFARLMHDDPKIAEKKSSSSVGATSRLSYQTIGKDSLERISSALNLHDPLRSNELLLSRTVALRSKKGVQDVNPLNLPNYSKPLYRNPLKSGVGRNTMSTAATE